MTAGLDATRLDRSLGRVPPPSHLAPLSHLAAPSPVPPATSCQHVFMYSDHLGTPMTLRSTVGRHPLAAFFLLSYGISWTCWTAARTLYPPTLLPAQRAPAQLLFVLGTFGPFVAAVVVAWATGTASALKARLFRWRVAPRWYLLAVGVPVVAVVLAYAAYRLLGGASVDLSRTPAIRALAATFVFTLVAGGGNEEPGWRGFALPRLQDRFGLLAGTVILAVLWAGWHVPAFLDPASSQSLLPPAAWAVGVLATSLVLTWLFNAAAESVPVVALYHTTFNVAGLWVIVGLPADAVGPFYWTGVAAYCLFAVALAVVTRGGLGASGSPGREPAAVTAPVGNGRS